MAKSFGKIDHDSGKLISEHGHGHKKQPHGKAIGASTATGKAAHHPHFGSPDSFRISPAKNAHGFKHEGGLRQGALRLSGHSGAHQVGRKKGK